MFSWWEYENPTAEHAKMSSERGWLGEEIPYNYNWKILNYATGKANQ
jgi:hypothetical protein